MKLKAFENRNIPNLKLLQINYVSFLSFAIIIWAVGCILISQMFGFVEGYG